jgi:hypothetical protein
MYPEVFPGAFDQADPEFIVYQQLRRLPDRYVVFFSKRFKGGLFGAEECEIDFIVCNQKNVMICLEVKGGRLSYDGAADRWYQNGEPMKRSPEKQASAATHALIRHLKDKIRNIAVDWALCFPQCCLEKGETPTGLPDAHMIDERKLENIEQAFRILEDTVRAKFSRQGMSAWETENLVAALTRSIGFVQKLGVRFARERDQLIQVTQEQLEILDDLEGNPRMLVQGAAGTGKTILAQEFSKRLLAAGKSVLLLFYNKGIARKVRYGFSKDDNIEVTTFSSFAKRLVEEHAPDLWRTFAPKDDEFWTMHLPLRLLELPDSVLPKFDAVLVDEGQDFKPEWYEFLERLLKSKADSHYCSFLDEHQDIFGHWERFPTNPQPYRKLLKKNCRNTRKIVEYIQRIYPTEMSWYERSPVGVDVMERYVSGPIDEKTQLLRDIRRLIEQDEVVPGSMVILINRPKKESCLAETKRIGKFPLESTYGRHDEKAKCTYYSTIDIFKGLEADVIFMVDCDRFNREELAQQVYIQGSRARHDAQHADCRRSSVKWNRSYKTFQPQAVRAIVKDFSAKPNGRFLLVIPTGGGKTFTAMRAIGALFASLVSTRRSQALPQPLPFFLEYSVAGQETQYPDCGKPGSI